MGGGRCAWREPVDPDDMARANLWYFGTVPSALRSKRGKAVLRRLEAALLALPAERLIAGAVVAGGDVCAFGAYCASMLAASAGSMERAIAELARLYPADGSVEECAEVGAGIGDLVGDAPTPTFPLVWALVEANDEGRALETPEERYARVLRWVRWELDQPHPASRRARARPAVVEGVGHGPVG